MRIRSRDGGEFDAELVRPDATRRPGIIVLTPIFGVEAGMREVLERYASRGYIVVAPDLFWRVAPGPLQRTEAGMHAANDRKKKVDVASCLDDVAATIDALRALPECNGSVAIVGFCFGGRYAYLAAADLDVAAAAAFHPTEIGQTLEAAPRVTRPLSLHFGGQDAIVSMAEVQSIARALDGNPHVEIYVYPEARHSFAVPQTPAYDAAAAALGEDRAFALFERVVRH